jgi:hypothetical protein
MEIHKFKRLIYSLTSILLYTLIMLGSFYILYNFDSNIDNINNMFNQYIARFFYLCSIIFLDFILLVFIESMLFKEKTHSIIRFLVPFKNHKEKWIFHSELGPFLIMITKKRITIFKQNYLTLIEIERFKNIGDVKLTIVKIKDILDKHFLNVTETINNDNNSKEILNSLDKWDGYLDTQTRINNKINKLLKWYQ